MGVNIDPNRRLERDKRFKIFLRTISLNWRGITFVVLSVALLVFQWDWFAARTQIWLQALGMLLQIFMAIAFGIMQFVAIFWFLARSRIYWVQPGETGIGFKDYRGNPDVVEVSRRVVTLLRGVRKFKQMGGQMSKGLLLIGPPGTGKSYLAQAIATEAGIPFAYLSAPSLTSMFFGVGNLKVMGLYRKARKMARKYGACVVFIDEIDAIGGARGSSTANTGGGMGMMGGMFGAGSMLLNELLMQMDPPNVEDGWIYKFLRMLGLRTKRAEQPVVFTMAATNLPEVLDKALLRPGRFDRKIIVDLPDYDGRKDVIGYYLAKVRHDPGMSLDRLSQDSIGYSPAEIKFVINEAVASAHFSGRDMITYKDWSAAREFHEWGLRQPIRSMSKEDRRRIAYHEAGHCVAAYHLMPNMPPVKTTIIRHTGFLGVVQMKPIEERHTQVKEEVVSYIRVSLASRAAEELFLGTQMTGVTSDLSQATRLAAAYVGMWGMAGSFYSNLAFGQGVPDGQQKKQIEELLEKEYKVVKRLIKLNERAVHAIAEALIEREELDKDEIDEIIRSQPGRAMRDEDRTRLAFHEAGHCVAMYLLQPDTPPERASIIPDSGSAGFVQPTFEVQYTHSREELLAEIQVCLSSRAAERIFLGTELDGAASDFSKAVRLAEGYFKLGMGGNLVVGQGKNDERVEKLLDDQYKEVARILSENSAAVKIVAEALMERNELAKDEIRELIEQTRGPVGGGVAAH